MKILDLYIRIVVTILFCIGTILNVQCQSSLFSYEHFVHNGDTLKYRLLISDYDTVSKYPLVVFLHGAGERGNDNEAQLKWGVQNFASDQVMMMHKPIVIAPQCPLNMTWRDFTSSDMALQSSPTKPMKLLLELINESIAKMSIDTDRIYITGLSMGGYGTFDAISRLPHLFAAAVPICGAGDIAQAEAISHIPMWMFHGGLDTTVDPKYTQNMYNALIKVGAHPGVTIYPDVGHFAWIPAYDDSNMIDWLFKQTK